MSSWEKRQPAKVNPRWNLKFLKFLFSDNIDITQPFFKIHWTFWSPRVQEILLENKTLWKLHYCKHRAQHKIRFHLQDCTTSRLFQDLVKTFWTLLQSYFKTASRQLKDQSLITPDYLKTSQRLLQDYKGVHDYE